MPRKREVLLALKRDELVDAADRFDVSVRDRGVRADLVESLAASRKAGVNTAGLSVASLARPWELRGC